MPISKKCVSVVAAGGAVMLGSFCLPTFAQNGTVTPQTTTTTDPTPPPTTPPSTPVPTVVTNSGSNPVNVTVHGGIHITNTQVPTSDVNKPAHVPFAKSLLVIGKAGYGTYGFTVPSGKRLVITYISSTINGSPGDKEMLEIVTVTNSEKIDAHFPVTDQGAFPMGAYTFENFSSSDKVELFADAGSYVEVSLTSNNNLSISGSARVTVTGYLVDASAPSFE